MAKVSIIVPVHNTGKYLIPMINSLINQTFKDIEILLIDDGSTDGTQNAIKQFEKQDNRIISICRTKSSIERFGQKYSVDLGISLATGKYIMIIDHDDELTLDAIENLYNYTNNGSIDVVQGRYIQIDDQHNILFRTPNIWNQPTVFTDLDDLSIDVLLLHLAYAPVALWACLIKKELINNLELADCVFNDTSFIWELKIKAKTFCYIPNEIYIYHSYIDSTSGSSNADKVVYDMLLSMEHLERFLKQQTLSPKLWQIFYVFKFYSFNKMHAGISANTRYEYFKKVHTAIQSDKDITFLLLACPTDQSILINYLLLRNAKT